MSITLWGGYLFANDGGDSIPEGSALETELVTQISDPDTVTQLVSLISSITSLVLISNFAFAFIMEQGMHLLVCQMQALQIATH